MVWPVWVVQTLIAIGLSIVSSMLMRPKVEGAKPQQGRVPEAKDGTFIRKIYGTVWIDDSMILGYKALPPEPIRKKGKK